MVQFFKKILIKIVIKHKKHGRQTIKRPRKCQNQFSLAPYLRVEFGAQMSKAEEEEGACSQSFNTVQGVPGCQSQSVPCERN